MIDICLCTLVLIATPSGSDPLDEVIAWHTTVGETVQQIEDEAAAAEAAAEAKAIAREAAVEAANRSEARTPPTPPPTSSNLSTSLDWAALRECESGGNYSINTGNGYYGAYQFSLSTWESMGGSGLPSDASATEQDMRAQKLYDISGASPWPVCGLLL